MENTGFKGLLVTLYQRVVVSYKTTLLGLAFVAASTFVDFFSASTNKTVAAIFITLGTVLTFIKEQGIVKVPSPT